MEIVLSASIFMSHVLILSLQTLLSSLQPLKEPVVFSILIVTVSSWVIPEREQSALFNTFITHPVLPFFEVLMYNCPSIVDAFFMFTFIVCLLDDSDDLEELLDELENEDELDDPPEVVKYFTNPLVTFFVLEFHT